MPPITGTFDTVKGHNGDLLRKMLEMAIFVQPYSAPAINTITDATGAQLVIPDGMISVGMTSKDEGAVWTPNLEISETGAYGYGQPVRRDAQSRALTLGFTMLEAKRQVFELYYGIDLSAVKAGLTKNELSWATPSRPNNRLYRVLAIGRDGQGTDAIYHGEYLPKCTVTDVAELTWSETDPESYGVTLAPQIDSAVGTSQLTFWGGPGFTTSVITAMGFTRSAT